MVLPSGFTSTIAAIETTDGPVAEAFPPMSVTIRLADEIDISRGDLICRPHNAPHVTQDVEAMVCWMSDQPADGRAPSWRSSTPPVGAGPGQVDLHYRLDVNTLHRDEGATQLGLNEIGRVRLRTTQPLFADAYRRNRTTGGLHPHRRGHQRHRRRRHDSRELTGP